MQHQTKHDLRQCLLVLFLGALIGSAVVAVQKRLVSEQDCKIRRIPKDAARIVSYEGDVRIVRAATRETIFVTRATYVAAGDTVQTRPTEGADQND